MVGYHSVKQRAAARSTMPSIFEGVTRGTRDLFSPPFFISSEASLDRNCRKISQSRIVLSQTFPKVPVLASYYLGSGPAQTSGIPDNM